MTDVTTARDNHKPEVQMNPSRKTEVKEANGMEWAVMNHVCRWAVGRDESHKKEYSGKQATRELIITKRRLRPTPHTKAISPVISWPSDT